MKVKLNHWVKSKFTYYPKILYLSQNVFVYTFPSYPP
jgi:hypothetical protein